MRKLFLTFTAAFALLAMAAGVAMAQSKEFKKTVEFNAGGELRVSTDRSVVRLTSWDRNEVDVYARIVKPEEADSDFDPRAIEATRIEVIGDARSLTIRTNFEDVPTKDGRMWGSRTLPEVHLDIRAPRNLNLNLDADRGQIELRGLEGRLNLGADRSSVKAEDLAGELRLRVDRGSVNLSNVRAALDFHSDRTNGKLLGARITGDSRIEVDRGEVELVAPAAQGLYVSANRSRRAEFVSDFAITTRSFNGERIEGEINGGGPRLTIQTDRGRVRLRQQ
ncbi:MAG: hypothetical protein AB7U82_18070 [Blastocatellales bacterium]